MNVSYDRPGQRHPAGGTEGDNHDAGNRRVFETSNSRQGEAKYGGGGVAFGGGGREGRSF